MVNVLILCIGNSVRSQMAEAYFNFYAKGRGLFFSAGVENTDINPYAIEVMAEDNIDLNEHSSKSIEAFKDIPFDHVITVCDPEDKSFLSDLDYVNWHHLPVIDPASLTFATEEEKVTAFRNTRDELKRIVLRFIGQELLQSSEKYTRA